MAYPRSDAGWFYGNVIAPRRGIHDIWTSESHIKDLQRRRQLLQRFRQAAHMCRLKSREKEPLAKLKELFAESTTGIDRLVIIENRWRFWIFCTVYVVFLVLTIFSIGEASYLNTAMH